MRKVLTLSIICCLLFGCSGNDSENTQSSIVYKEDSIGEITYQISSDWTVGSEKDNQIIYEDPVTNTVILIACMEMNDADDDVEYMANIHTDKYKKCSVQRYGNNEVAACIESQEGDDRDLFIYCTRSHEYYIMIDYTESDRHTFSEQSEAMLRSITITNPTPYNPEGSKLLFDPFDQYRFGMSVEEAKDTIIGEQSLRTDIVNTQYSAVLNLEDAFKYQTRKYWGSYILGFNNNKLCLVQMDFKPTSDGLVLRPTSKYETYSEAYMFIRNVLIEAYGEPFTEDFKYSDDTYKDDIDKAIKYNYLEIMTTWILNDMYIELVWSHDLMQLSYVSTQY